MVLDKTEETALLKILFLFISLRFFFFFNNSRLHSLSRMVTIVILRDYLPVLSLTPNSTADYFLDIEFKCLGSFLQRETSNTYVSGGEKEPKTLKRRKEERDSVRSCFCSSSWGLGPRGKKMPIDLIYALFQYLILKQDLREGSVFLSFLS